MIDALFNQTNYVATKRMLDMSVLRQEAIASNLENLETPGYKRLDVNPSFNEELTRALSSSDSANLTQLKPTLMVDATAVGNTRDGNTVQLESEMMQLMQNSVAHNVETQLITGKLLQMRLAITGRMA
jgi:flagellar basal-body rod protein FlgB